MKILTEIVLFCRDAMVVTTLDTFTSLLAGTTIFGILGNLAHELNVEVKDVVNAGGTGLAFISYPEAIAKFESVPWLFAILFFVMLLVLGVGSLVALQGCAITVIMDSFPSLKSWQVSLGTAIVGFLIGLVYVTPGGQYMLNMVDHFGGTFVIFVVTLIEVLTVMWWYGLENFCIDLEFMLKRKVHVYFRVMWGLVTPIVLILIFVYFILTLKRLEYGTHGYPDSILAFGWLILAVTVLQLLMWACYYLYSNREYGCVKMVSKSFSSENWGPANSSTCEEYKKFKEDKLQEMANLSPTQRLLHSFRA
ncbi:PREDICTED: sodium-dependent nutrient amino acid transporter 1-like [Nicrophorus vespilloides]|uniref:Sodium-dependent nutrient amino acid transporter 1 n=1 Tax=Nicrophorus vespilloides TaxID=110193 RepID=A0ABM1NG59_NICVS|nr:PREDICTED: sodium-dependent nutrient amino acid transporter 1-like [Nicrophorus vespilloides]